MAKDDKVLIKMFKDLYCLEKQAKEIYDEYLRILKDKKEIEIISSIRDDEIRHMEITKELQRLVE
ncbi:MAG: hypothetical protein WC675_03480 [Patescibacteria group bacterium]|jgi:rubrerythrin